MSIFKKIALLFVLVSSSQAMAYEHDSYYDNDSYYHEARQGWDISPREAEGASNCYYYSLYASNGKGSARIMSFSGKNYIQVSNGQKSGYVCFNGYPMLELGKLADPNVSVELYIEEIGSFNFYTGDTGSKHINNWYRKYMGI